MLKLAHREIIIGNSMLWLGVTFASIGGTQGCGASQGRGACLGGTTRVIATRPNKSDEWSWFEFPAETDELFRRQALSMVSAAPLWLRTNSGGGLSHIRVVAATLGELKVAEIQWDGSRADAEFSTLATSGQHSYLFARNRDVQMILDKCVDVVTAGCLGGTIESREWSDEVATLDGTRGTVELRVGDGIYAIARKNPGQKAKERGLIELNRCACEVLRLSDGATVCD